MPPHDRFASPMIGYLVQSLVDTARGAPSDDAVLKAVERWSTQKTSDDGQIPAAIPVSSSALFDHGNIDKELIEPLFPGTRLPKTPPRVREVVIAPEVHVLKATGGAPSQRGARALIPLLVAAEINELGVVVPRKGALPWVPRQFLEPQGAPGPTVGTLDDLESELGTIDSNSIRAWEHLADACVRVYQRVTGEEPGQLRIPGYELVEDLALLIAEGDRINISGAVRGVLEKLPTEKALPPLLQRYLHEEAAPSPPKNLIQQQKKAADHMGQMGKTYPLSPNQRQALHHVLDLCANESGQILAVNGPPGTGKTTLLQSVVASLWVQRALLQSAPPVIVATSTNNQAVTNILDSFGAADGGKESTPLARRWLDGLYSHGVFHASSARDPGEYQFISSRETNLPLEVDELERSRLSARFLDQARELFQRHIPNIPAVMESLHNTLREECHTIQAAAETMHEFRSVHGLEGHTDRASKAREDLDAQLATQENARDIFNAQRAAFLEHFRRRPLLLRWLAGFVWAFWPGAFKNLRAENRASTTFLATRGAPHTDKSCFHAFSEAEKALQAAIEAARKERDESRRTEQELRRLLRLGESVPLDGLLSKAEANLDCGPRYRAFWLATHYWEARWLVESAKPKNQAAPKQQRLAMLAPCHVATCYMLPAVHGRLLCATEEKIDLLLMDESGQVSPEVGAAAFALAHNALVIGDTYQLEPVWGVQPALDRANLRRFDLNGEVVRRLGLSASSGSVMQVAQRACRYRQFPAPHPSGLFLTEHRRCRDPIIAYCNELTYGGVLEPLRGSHGAKLNIPAMALFPVVGKTSSSSGGSRSNKSEAEAIAAWIEEHLSQIKTAYGASTEEAVLGLIGIVTPFRAQSVAISRALFARGLPACTVGTVHALQGAERAIVIFSPTYSAAERPGRLFFDVGPNMLNVAVSRAKDHFLVFGDPGVICVGKQRTPSSLLASHLSPKTKENRTKEGRAKA